MAKLYIARSCRRYIFSVLLDISRLCSFKCSFCIYKMRPSTKSVVIDDNVAFFLYLITQFTEVS